MSDHRDRVEMPSTVFGINGRYTGMVHRTMKPETIVTTKAAALTEEIESIYSANHLYWKSGAIHRPAANEEHDLRQLRLKEILRELDELWRAANVKPGSAAVKPQPEEGSPV
jgi:hypothetical protein